MRPRTILYAEDEENDIFFLQYALEEVRSPHELKAVPDGQKAIEYLAGEGDFADRKRYPFPSLVLLDINMPKKSGLEVLEWIRRQSKFKSLPVLMLTSSSRQEDMDRALKLGADDYLSKPAHPIAGSVGQVLPGSLAIAASRLVRRSLARIGLSLSKPAKGEGGPDVTRFPMHAEAEPSATRPRPHVPSQQQ